jgi:hypothetical protein
VNGFLLSHAGTVSAWTAVIVSTVVSAFAFYLVIERSYGDEKPRRGFFEQLWWVATKELSGAAFYALLILITWAGVVVTSGWPTQS